MVSFGFYSYSFSHLFLAFSSCFTSSPALFMALALMGASFGYSSKNICSCRTEMRRSFSVNLRKQGPGPSFQCLCEAFCLKPGRSYDVSSIYHPIFSEYVSRSATIAYYMYSKKAVLSAWS